MHKKRLFPLLMTFLLVSASWAEAVPTGDSQPMGQQEIEVGSLDLTIIFAYLIGIVALGCWAGMRRKRAQGSDYFLASKSLKWPVIGLALFATNISTLHLVSFAQNGYTSGLVYGNFEWMAAFTLVILSLFFAPFYLRSKVATLPDFMEKRYSRGSRDYLAVLSIFSAIAVHIGFSLWTGSIVLEGTVLPAFVDNPDQYRLYTIIAMCGVTAIYTIIGGLLAVVLTESIQTIVLLIGAICITLIGMNMIGSWGELTAAVHPVNFSITRPSVEPTGITWYAVFLGYPVLGIWYWCTDQTIVQRVLGAKDENHARVGPLFAGFIKILPVFLFVLPGIICLALVNTNKIPALPTLADGSPDTKKTYTHMINTMLTPGLRGVVIAALLAALMSTVSGALNSIATLFSYDIYKRWKPSADDNHLVWVGRMATFVAMCVAVAWTLILGAMEGSIFQRMVDMFSVVAPPTAVVFVWGVFWRKTSATAALITLIGGSIVGLVIAILTLLEMIGVNSLLLAFYLFVAESVVIVVLSFIFPHKHTAESEALVWKSPLAALRGENTWRGLLDFRILSAVLVVTMVGFYVWFSDSETYYPIGGKVTLAGEPVVGATVYLDAENDMFDVKLSTGTDGTYQYGTDQMAGGAPEGTKYRIRIEPNVDYLVKADEKDPKKKTILDVMPPGSKVKAPLKAGESILRATDVPQKYRDFDSSGLELIVTAKEKDKKKDKAKTDEEKEEEPGKYDLVLE